MSIQTTYPEKLSRNDSQPTNEPIVTQHARLRYRQRVEAVGVSVDEELRNMYRRGTPVATDHGRGRRDGEHVVVFQDGERPVLKTVLYAEEGER